MPTARRCQGCGATLNDPPAGSTSLTCPFCGLTHDMTQAFPAPVVVRIGGVTPQPPKHLGTIIGVVVVVILGATIIPIVFSLRMASNAIQQATSSVPSSIRALQDQRRPIAPAELSDFTERRWKELDVAPPPGGYRAFDPVTALPWAMTIGRAWAKDAALQRIDVGRVSSTGVVDLAGEDTSGYRFVSAARQARWRNDVDAGVKSVTPTALMVQIKGTVVSAILHDDDRDRDVGPPASLPLPAILETARRGRGFPDRPFYSGYMIHLPREGWVWYFRAPSGDSFPRVRARDGRVYPY